MGQAPPGLNKRIYMRWYAYLTGSFLIFQTRKPYKPLDEIIDNPSPPLPVTSLQLVPLLLLFPLNLCQWLAKDP